MSGYALHPEARGDLNEIWEYIASDNIDAADRILDEILTRLDRLTSFPHQGFRRPELTSRPLRFVLVRSYLIAYAPDEHPLWVVAYCMASAARAFWRPFSGKEPEFPVLP
jgi:plasmid stabilization system protein ParE